MEAWKDIAGFEGFYQVSDLGRVKSLARVVVREESADRSRGRTVNLKERILRPCSKSTGHQNVGLWVGGRAELRAVHRLVLEAFVGPCPEGMECLHGPGGPSDNRLSNLRWGTPRENAADKVRDGTDARGEKHPRAKITAEDATMIRGRVEVSGAEWARRLGVSRSAVSLIRRGHNWKHLLEGV